MDENKKERQVSCCNCYWNDQCCMGCNVGQVDCDDYTPLYTEDEEDYLDYIIENDRQEDCNGCNENDTYSWSDSIIEAWLNGEDVTEDKWWS